MKLAVIGLTPDLIRFAVQVGYRPFFVIAPHQNDRRNGILRECIFSLFIVGVVGRAGHIGVR